MDYSPNPLRQPPFPDRRPPFDVAADILQSTFPDAVFAFVGGSFNRAEATKFSDIDLVVIFQNLPNAWRESFVFQAWPVEVFAHDPETLRYFFRDDANSGTPSLAANRFRRSRSSNRTPSVEPGRLWRQLEIGTRACISCYTIFASSCVASTYSAVHGKRWLWSSGTKAIQAPTPSARPRVAFTFWNYAGAGLHACSYAPTPVPLKTTLERLTKFGTVEASEPPIEG